MLFVPVIAGVVGALLMGRTKPRTECHRLSALGSRSGVAYDVEEFPSAGFLVVRAPDGSEGVFTRALQQKGKAPSGFSWSRGRGHPLTLKTMRADFGSPAKPATPAPNGEMT